MITALLFALVQSATPPAPSPPMVGGYGSAQVDAPEVVAAAKFAVRGHHKYRLKAIVSAKQQVVAGMNYDLCLALTGRHGPAWAQTVVYRDLHDHMQVSKWTMIDGCAG